MNTAATEIGQRSCMLDIEGVRLSHSSPGFAEAIVRAHGRRRRRRPLCLCRPEGIEMYIARWADGYIVERMPETGDRHAPDCPSFEPPAELSGIQPLLGSAIREDPGTGLTTLRLRFPLTRQAARTQALKTSRNACASACSTARLSLRALLHFLWDQAELTRRHPGFAHRRTWGAVRRQLHEAATRMYTAGDTLATRLYVPEPFCFEQRDAIVARRHGQWAGAGHTGSGMQRLLLLIAEVKEIVPSRHGYNAVIKHIPDIAFPLEGPLYTGLVRRFDQELAFWTSACDIHMIIMATLSFSTGGLPRIVELTLMTVTEQ